MGRKNLTFKQLERRRRLLRWVGIRGSTLRDWLPILIAAAIPILIFLGTRAITLQQADLENQRAAAEAERAEQRAQDEALRSYLNQMSGLLLERDLRTSEEDSEVRTLARARTLTVLGRLDPSRKTALMQFLVEADLVQRIDGRDPVISLRDADLREADLRFADLPGANLHSANLREAFLRDADGDPDLSFANLREADLPKAYLIDAKGVTNEQLTAADTLRGATMPDGQKYEVWLKNKGRGKDG